MAEQHHHPKLSDSAILLGPVRYHERRRLMRVVILTGITMIAEFVGGILTRSLALFGDALHMLTHFAAVGMSLLAVVVAMRPAPPDKTYRYWRAEVIASLINALALIPIAGYMLYAAYDRWRHPEPIEVVPMLIIGAVGLAVNIASAAMLHGHSKHDVNMRGAFLHMIADTASSIGVILAGVMIWVFRWHWSDPLIAALISVTILFWSVGLIRATIRILLESVPGHMDLEQIRTRMKTEEGVAEVHDLHIWTITSNMYSLTAHVILKEDLPVSRTEDLARRLQCLLDEEYDINHATLQFETAHHDVVCEHESGSGGAEAR